MGVPGKLVGIGREAAAGVLIKSAELRFGRFTTPACVSSC
jgi:hypothetical protein